jgi:hypothetical protein
MEGEGKFNFCENSHRAFGSKTTGHLDQLLIKLFMQSLSNPEQDLQQDRACISWYVYNSAAGSRPWPTVGSAALRRRALSISFTRIPHIPAGIAVGKLTDY